MFNRALNILLALGIFTCPLVCRGGDRCCGNEHAALEHVCCEECGANPADHDRGDKRGPGSNDGCQCICGGAVIEITTLHLYLDVCEWITPTIPIQVLAPTIEPQFDFVGTPPLPDDDMNPGRALRCRIMSFLC
jgi:hypothetical protein